MGDGQKITNEKQHRSTSSLFRYSTERILPERKLDLRSESDDQFAIAEARCLDLQDKLDQVKMFKRKRNPKKKSLTRVNEFAENLPTITVRTQPKMKLKPKIRMQRLEVPANPSRAYVDPATLEQRSMLGHVRNLGNSYCQPMHEEDEYTRAESVLSKHRPIKMGRSCADSGDGLVSDVRSLSPSARQATRKYDNCDDEDQRENYSEAREDVALATPPPAPLLRRKPWGLSSARRVRARPQNSPQLYRAPLIQRYSESKALDQKSSQRRSQFQPQQKQENTHQMGQPVVELFSSTKPTRRRGSLSLTRPHNARNKQGRSFQNYAIPESEQDNFPELVLGTEPDPHCWQQNRRSKYRRRRYEKPTVASQMKQAGMRMFYSNSNYNNIPFVASKSTAPSHNIGVNIQQVLNGLKVQQPLSGIPLTIAHHMGLGHISNAGTKYANVIPSLDNHEINVIKLGPRMLRLPTYKYMSYSRLLDMYREGDGMVPRFLRAISRPHYFYTSMYNLSTNQQDFDEATSKGHAGNQDAKQSLAEYTNLYREYELLEKYLNERYEPELEKRRVALTKELATKEQHIRKVVEEYNAPAECEASLRATVSNAESCFKSFKLNVGVGD